MIPIPEKLIINKFKRVHLPRTRDLVRRYGYRLNSGNNIPPDIGRNKLDSLVSMTNDLYNDYARAQNERDKAAELSQSQVESESNSI